MSKKNDNKVRILFCGQSAEDVTGSQIYIETPNKKILLECGMYQTVGDTLESWKVNSQKFAFNAKDLDYVFVQHLHIDHTGLIPLLYHRGYKNKIFAPQKTKQIANILLNDCFHIIDNDAKVLTTQYKKCYEPYYNSDDVSTAIDNWTEFPIEEIHVVDEFVKFRYVPAGHIINSCQLELWLTIGNLTKKIVFTSDLGNTHIKKPYIGELVPITKCDIAICETTYAHETRIANQKTRQTDIEKLKCVIEQTCINDHARILFPSFALQRTQDIITLLYQLYGNDENFTIPIIVDSPMGCNICDKFEEVIPECDADLWKNVRLWKNIRYIRDPNESKSIRMSKEPCIVIASSGFMLAGRSVAWCYDMLPNVHDRIVTIGYAPEGSIAYAIKNETKKELMISGKKRKNRCQITVLNSFTSHIQRDTMIDLYGNIDAQKIVLVHGDMDGRLSIKKDIQDRLSKNNKTAKVIVANKDMMISI